MGKFQIGDNVHCITHGRYLTTGIGVDLVVVRVDPLRVRLLDQPECTGYRVCEDHFELITPISLENV